MMIIPFCKITNDKTPFLIEHDGIIFEGSLNKNNDKLVKCLGKFTGAVKHSCDICGEPIEVSFNENLELLVSDGTYEEKNEFYLDVYECIDSRIHLIDILKSEIQANLSSYFYCEKCKF